MKGHLHIVCARDAFGRNHLRKQSFRAPMHLSKAHEDADSLVVNLVTPTAGVFDDDEIDFDIAVEAGARLVLTTPSSSRVYRSRDGGTGRVHKNLRVAAGGFLEFYPEPFIPHAGARYHQRNTLRLAEGAGAAFFEWLSPGRVASGERFQYAELRWDIDIWWAEQLAARERYALSPGDESLSALTLMFAEAHYLGCFVLGLESLPLDEIEALQSEKVYLGCGPLIAGGHAIKCVCDGALAARRTLRELRRLIYGAMRRPMPHLGRF